MTTDIKTIYFKATRKSANSCEGYRQIIKRGDLDVDSAEDSDDIITIFPGDRKIEMIKIDCNKKTGEFRMNIFYK